MFYTVDKHSHGRIQWKNKKLKNKFKFCKVKQMFKDPKVISCLNILQEQYVISPIDKAANNIAFMCKKFYVHVFIKELSLLIHFWPMFPFYTPWKHQRFSGVSRGYDMETLARNGLKTTSNNEMLYDFLQ